MEKEKRPMSIIEENPAAPLPNNVYGFKWLKCSCSFDTVGTVLLLLYSTLVEDDRAKFRSAWGSFGDIFPLTDMSSKVSVAGAKEKMMRIFIQNPLDPVFVLGTMYSCELVYQFIASSNFLVADERDIIRAHYEVFKDCPAGDCFIDQDTRKRVHNLYESNNNDGGANEESVQAFIDNYWLKRTHKCKDCGSDLLLIRKFRAAPSVIVVSVGGINIALDDVIRFDGSSYTIFAVAYRGNFYFNALVKLENKIYEYDGCVQDGLIRHRSDMTGGFNSVYTDASNNNMKSQLVWYKKFD